MGTYKILSVLFKPYGKYSFLKKLKAGADILDVGCGNNSPYTIKKLIPDCLYTGIDICDYRQTKPNMADRYILTNPEEFSGVIKSMNNSFDAVISEHNLEHCNDRWETLTAMINALKENGRLFLLFPSDISVNLPSRQGTLNYYDDSTHRDIPPDFDRIIKILTENNMKIIYSDKHYRPVVLRLIGLFMEPLSIIKKKIFVGTWAFHGFESVIWAVKNPS